MLFRSESVAGWPMGRNLLAPEMLRWNYPKGDWNAVPTSTIAASAFRITQSGLGLRSKHHIRAYNPLWVSENPYLDGFGNHLLVLVSANKLHTLTVSGIETTSPATIRSIVLSAVP